jgi:hypothetical protein
VVRELPHRLEQAGADSFGTRGRFVPYLSSEAVGLSFMRFTLAVILVTLASTAPAQSREQKPVDWRTFEVPISEQGSNIQRAFSVRLVSLKRALDSGLSGLMDALSCPFILVAMKPATIPQRQADMDPLQQAAKRTEPVEGKFCHVLRIESSDPLRVTAFATVKKMYSK